MKKINKTEEEKKDNFKNMFWLAFGAYVAAGVYKLYKSLDK